MSASKDIETTTNFTPKFNTDGLIPAIAQDAQTNQILMVAYMNPEALAETIKTGNAIYYSRSRQKLWRKGEQSGHVQKVKEILTDCDQDTIILKVTVDAGQCHTGYQSCFYRKLKPNTNDQLEFIAKPTYDPNKVY
ncbi:MAG: phosphoribosyl-AMP cyclohydrolase [Planctomycetes bacterium]|nr:phosphoribosyl-AMP cyclohydrolase [Planctomycetota bacterium]